MASVVYYVFFLRTKGKIYSVSPRDISLKRDVVSDLDLEMPGGPNATGEEIVKAVREGALSEVDLNIRHP